MTSLINTSEQLTMSSREIAELLEVRHDNVKRTIDTLTHKELVTFTQAEEKSNGGRPGIAYHVNQRDSYVIVAQLSPAFLARIVDRWQELEKQALKPALPDFNDPVAAARAWADECEQKRRLKADHIKLQVENDQLNNLFKDGISVCDFARQLNGVNIQQVQNFLVAKGWLLRSGSIVKTRSQYRDRYVADRIVPFVHPISREEMETSKPVLLKNGAQRLYQMYLNEELPMKANWNRSFTQEVMQ